MDESVTEPAHFARPEWEAGNYAADDEGVTFFSRVNALLDPSHTVLDLGCGRGSRFHYVELGYRDRLAKLQGKCARVIGIDPDFAIKDHPFLDERHVVPPGARWPIDDGTIDVIVCEWVLEHVDDPAHLSGEVARVLKPGGWFCALTPNKWGYVGIANRLMSERLKSRSMRVVWPERTDRDVFPTRYRMNTKKALRKCFPMSQWRDCSYFDNPTPKYHGNREWLFDLVSLYQWLMPRPLRTNLLVFAQRL